MASTTEPGAVPTAQEEVVLLVPRINVHAYCDTQDAADIIRQAAADRRMSRAHSTVSSGGVAAAVETYQNKMSPNLLIVESAGSQQKILEGLSALAEVCQPETKVIVIGVINDVGFYRQLIHQGISEYLVKPVQPLQVIEAIGQAYAKPLAAPLGRVIAFMGAKGGVGSSTLAQNVSWTLATAEGLDTVLADLDLAFGCAGLNFNQEVPPGLADVLGQPERVDAILLERMLIKIDERLNLLSGPGGFGQDFQIEPIAMDTLFSAMRTSVPFLVLDLPAIWAPWTKFALQNAEQIVITATPDLASLRNVKSLTEQLLETRPNDPPPVVVINQAGIPKRPEIKPAEFSKAIGLPIETVIPFDAQSFGSAQTNGQMIGEFASKSKAADAISSLSKSLAGPGRAMVADGRQSRSLLAKLPFIGRKK